MNVHKKRLSWALAVACFLWAFLVSETGSIEREGLLAGFGLLAVALEVAAFRLPNWGLVSSAPAVYLAVALHPQVGPSGAAWLASAGLALRGALRSKQDLQGAVAEAIGDLLPVLAWLVALEAVAPWPGAWVLVSLVYLVLAAAFPQMLTRYPTPLWYRAKLKGFPFLAAALILSPLLIAEDRYLVPSLLCVVVLSYAIGQASQIEETEDRKLLSLRLWHQQRQRRALEEELETIARADHSQSKVLKATLSALNSAATTTEALEVLVVLAGQLVPARSVLFFSPEAESLSARHWHGLENADAALAEASENELYHQAWREGKPLARSSDALIQGQSEAAGLPVPGYGALYLCRQDPFSAAELDNLWLMARQAAVLISKIEERESRERALAFVSEERRLLSRWVFRLNRLLDDSRSIVGAREVAAMLETSRASLEALIPHRVFLSYELLPDGGLAGAAAADQQTLRDLADSLQPGQPPRRHATWPRQWQPLTQPIQSVMGVMLATRPARVLVLGDSATGAFSAEHGALFCLLAQQVEVAANNLRLGREYTEAAKTAAVGQIAAGLSHELNTPLCSIQLSLGSALSALENDPDTARERLARAEASCETASSILKTLLYYTTSYGSEAGERLDLAALVQEVSGTFRCSLVGSVGPLLLTGHPLDLEQMLLQLFKNASVHGEPFEVELESSGEEILLRVRDQGPGVEPAIAERIFEPFFTTQPPGKGLGLGLALSRRVAELHGGTLRLLRSSRGACFEVRLPCH